MTLDEAYKIVKESDKKYYCYVLRDGMKPFYVGIGSGYRIKEHQYDCNSVIRGGKGAKTGNKHKLNKMLKIQRLGGSVDYHLVGFYDSWEEACEVEIELISFVGRADLGTGPLVNKTSGGEGIVGTVHTEERRKKMSESFSGENHPFYGKRLSEAHRKAISEGNKGRVVSEETKEKMRKPKPEFSEEHKRKISEAKKGTKLSEEVKEKISKGQEPFRERARQQMLELHKNPEVVGKIKVALDSWRASDENKEQARRHKQAQWEDQGTRQKLTESIRESAEESKRDPVRTAKRIFNSVGRKCKSSPEEKVCKIEKYIAGIAINKPPTRDKSLLDRLLNEEYKAAFTETLSELLNKLKEEISYGVY